MSSWGRVLLIALFGALPASLVVAEFAHAQSDDDRGLGLASDPASDPDHFDYSGTMMVPGANGELTEAKVEIHASRVDSETELNSDLAKDIKQLEAAGMPHLVFSKDSGRSVADDSDNDQKVSIAEWAEKNGIKAQNVVLPKDKVITFQQKMRNLWIDFKRVPHWPNKRDRWLGFTILTVGATVVGVTWSHVDGIAPITVAFLTAYRVGTAVLHYVFRESWDRLMAINWLDPDQPARAKTQWFRRQVYNALNFKAMVAVKASGQIMAGLAVAASHATFSQAWWGDQLSLGIYILSVGAVDALLGAVRGRRYFGDEETLSRTLFLNFMLLCLPLAWDTINQAMHTGHNLVDLGFYQFKDSTAVVMGLNLTLAMAIAKFGNAYKWLVYPEDWARSIKAGVKNLRTRIADGCNNLLRGKPKPVRWPSGPAEEHLMIDPRDFEKNDPGEVGLLFEKNQFWARLSHPLFVSRVSYAV